MYSEKIFKRPIKLWTSPFPAILQTFYYSKGTRSALKGHLGIWGTRVLEGHSRSQGTWETGYCGTQGAQALGVLGC